MTSPLPISLYLHVPYCRALCHYCDFAKTANFDASHAETYFQRLTEHVQHWKALLGEPQFSSVFLGGGTPSLFTEQWRPVFATVAKNIQQGAEVTIETNPDDISLAALSTWRDVGINRLSMGIQTFEPRGLKLMKRTHSTEVARDAFLKAREVMPTVNIDLIYGWPGQSFADWRLDLETALRLDPQHLSLYVLTFESKTALGRAYDRGKIDAAEDETLLKWYLYARDLLTGAGYDHVEVSNFAKPGHVSKHNRHYWRHRPYVGVGTGAHGFLPSGDWGERFAYDRNDRLFQKQRLPTDMEPVEALSHFGTWEQERSRDDWLTELVVTGIRTAEGIDLDRAERQAASTFVPRGMVTESIAKGLLTIDDDRLRLAPQEWFRENSWGSLVRDCFV